MSEAFKAKYSHAIGFDPWDPTNKRKTKALLEVAENNRRFELDLYWRRAAYFWAFQAVAFAGLGFLMKEAQADRATLNVVLLAVFAALGSVTSFIGFLTALGSKFWQENWEAHVDLLEDALQQSVYRTIILRAGVQYSVSKANQALLIILGVGWVLTLVFALFPAFGTEVARVLPMSHWPMAALLTLVGVGVATALFGRSDLSGRRYNLGEDGWSSFGTKKDKRPSIIWRDVVGLKLRSE